MKKSHNSSNRGFAAMDESNQQRIASLGGRAAHQSGRAHEFDSAEARRAGHLGGTTVSRDRSHMAAIGAKGGRARGSKGNRRDGQVPADPQAGVTANAQGGQPAHEGGDAEPAEQDRLDEVQIVQGLRVDAADQVPSSKP